MKMNTFLKVVLLAGGSAILFSCEKVVDIDVPQAEPVLVVDAWITNKPEPQVVKLTYTQPYFDSSLPTGASGATVSIVDDQSTVFNFIEDTSNPGKYLWTPPVGSAFGGVGRKYKLTVLVGGETFESISVMKRTTLVDSITFKPEQTRVQYPDGSYVAEFWGKDSVGVGDAYWIRAYKNGVLLNKPSEINLAFDSGFSPGGDFDGVTFIPPIRRSVNAMDKDPKDDTKVLSPISSGDSIYVELHSLTLEAFNHVTQLKAQANQPGGFGELFAKPISNISTNVINTNSSGSKVVGFFCVSAVSGNGKKFVK